MKRLSDATTELIRSPNLIGTVILVPEEASVFDLAQLFLDLSVHYLKASREGVKQDEKENSKEESY